MNETRRPDPNELYQEALSQHTSGNLDKAIEIYRDLMKHYPDNVQVLCLLGTAETQRGNFSESLNLFGNALKIYPEIPEAHYNQGIALLELKRFDEAVHSYDFAIQLRPDYPEAQNNRGIALQELKRAEEALLSYDLAIRLRPDFPDAHNNRGIALKELKRLEESLLCFDRVIQVQPDFPDAHNYRGIVLQELKRFDEALQSFDRAIQLRPDYPEAHNNRGTALKELKRLDEALRSYEYAIQLKPDNDFWFGNYISTKLSCCDWKNFNRNNEEVLNGIINNEKVNDPFLTLIVSDSPDIQKQSAELLVINTCFLRNSANILTKYPRHDKIRLGYFSADYRDHPVSHLIAEMFEKHDGSRYEVYGFSFGPESNDPWRTRAQKCFDRFFNISFMSDYDTVRLARDHQIDIAIDLMGFTADSRPNIFAGRAAPVQVNYLGYPGTMGAEFIDYIVADTTIIPERDRHHYTEKVVYLPDCYQANCRNRDVSRKVLTRDELELPSDGFVFCCFNNNFKVTPTMFDSWMRILLQVEESVLWLLESNGWAADNLRAEAEKRGVDRERVVFAAKWPIEDHLNRISHADLFLDTLPYNAHTTASDALRMGVPLVTLTGNAFAGRVAASLLKTLDLGELIAHSVEEYENIAVDLATNREKLLRIKEKLNAKVQTSPLYDSDTFTRHMEKAYELMYERYRNDLEPDHIVV